VAGLVLVLGAGCATGVSQRDRDLAHAHLGLSQQSLGAGDPRGALEEIETAVAHDPTNAEVRNLYALLLHVSFGQLERAEAQYRKALELEPGYSDSKVNLSALLMAQGRCGEAIRWLEEAREDLLYREPYLVENNLGWCRYQLGDPDAAVQHLQRAVAVNPGFCLGHRNLGEVMESQGRYEEALAHYEAYGARCPQVADADLRMGLVHLELGNVSRAREAFLACEAKAEGDLAQRCRREAALLR
jgi:type IV pilus biogenesis/stability protein PilW